MPDLRLSQGAVSNPPNLPLTGDELIFASQEQNGLGWKTIICRVSDILALTVTRPVLEAAVAALQLQINGKAPAVHGHTIAQVQGLQDALDGKALAVHAHPINQVTGLQQALDGKSPVGHGHTIDQISGLSGELAARAVLGQPAYFSEIRPSAGAQGFQMYWNAINPGNGRNEYVNNHGGGDGGHFFWKRGSSSDGFNLQAYISAGSSMWTAGGYDTGSSEKLKHIDGPIPYTLEDLERIETCVGRYREDYNAGNDSRVFYRAENLLGIIPELVKPKGVEYHGEMVPVVKMEQTGPLNTHFLKLLTARDREQHNLLLEENRKLRLAVTGLADRITMLERRG